MADSIRKADLSEPFPNTLILRSNSELTLPSDAHVIPYTSSQLNKDSSYVWNLKRTKVEEDKRHLDPREFLHSLFQHGKIATKPRYTYAPWGMRERFWRCKCTAFGRDFVVDGRAFSTKRAAKLEVAELAMYWYLFEFNLPPQRISMPLVMRAPQVHMQLVAPTRFISNQIMAHIQGQGPRGITTHGSPSFRFAPGIQTPVRPKVDLPLAANHVQYAISKLQLPLERGNGRLPIHPFIVDLPPHVKLSQDLAKYIRATASIFSKLPIISHRHTGAISGELATRITARMKRYSIPRERGLMLVEQFYRGASEVLDNRADKTVSYHGWSKALELQNATRIELSLFAEMAFAVRGTQYIPHTKTYCRALGQEVAKQLRQVKWAFAKSLVDGIFECVQKDIMKLKERRRSVEETLGSGLREVDSE